MGGGVTADGAIEGLNFGPASLLEILEHGWVMGRGGRHQAFQKMLKICWRRRVL